MFHDSLRNRRSLSHEFKRDAVHRISARSGWPGVFLGPTAGTEWQEVRVPLHKMTRIIRIRIHPPRPGNRHRK
jgi:hypothetical protein